MKIKVKLGSGEGKAFLKLMSDNGYAVESEETGPIEAVAEEIPNAIPSLSAVPNAPGPLSNEEIAQLKALMARVPSV